MRLFMEKIKYLGHIIDKNGRKPDSERATVIKDMPAPENVFSRQNFLGLASNYQVFKPNICITYDFKRTSEKKTRTGSGHLNALKHSSK